jgi:hypothetical protein
MAQPDRPHENIRGLMHFACWTTKATTLLEYLILTAVVLQQWLPERVSVLRYKYIHCLLCPWSKLLSCAVNLATFGRPVVVVTPVQPPTGPSPLFCLYFISLFFTWPWAVECFPCRGYSLALWSSWVFRASSGEVVMIARRREWDAHYTDSYSVRS